MRKIIFFFLLDVIANNFIIALVYQSRIEGGYEIDTYSEILLSVENYGFGGKIYGMLTINNKKIRKIAPNAFKNLSIDHLILDLADTTLDINQDSFKGLPSLRTLWISAGFVPVERNLFEYVKNLRSLLLKIERTSLPLQQAIQKLPYLESLTLIDSDLLIFNNRTFVNCPPTISYLELSGNNITWIGPNTFSRLKNLKYLSLCSNALGGLQIESLNGLYKLETLQISSNKISTINAGCFNDLGSLRLMDFRANQIHSIQRFSFADLRISTLLLAKNRLQSLHKGMFSGLTKLDVLNLDFNQIKNIEIEAFAGLIISSLSLRNNMLEKILPRTFIGLSLGTLDVSNNKIHSMKDISTDWFIINEIYLNNYVYSYEDVFSKAKNATFITYKN